MARVSIGGRLHFGFCNLSLARPRLYGAIGVAVDEPRTVLTAERSDHIECKDAVTAEYAALVCDRLDVEGATISVEESIPRHVGLGSGTQLALATLIAVATAHGIDVDPREHAPALGRGGRSGVGVAAFDRGGFILDGGHPTGRFTAERPADGQWTVPAIAARHEIPNGWRFLLVLPETDAGRNGEAEDASMRTVVERADPELSDRIAGAVVRQVLPAIAEGSPKRFGEAVSAVGRLNGAWYAEQQGGVYRPPVGSIVDRLEESPAIYGAGQSSWGPIVYGVTDERNAPSARSDAVDALSDLGVDGTVRLARGRNHGVDVDPEYPG